MRIARLEEEELGMRSERVGGGGGARGGRAEVVVELEELTGEHVTPGTGGGAGRVRRLLEAARERHREHHVHQKRRAAAEAFARRRLDPSGVAGGRLRLPLAGCLLLALCVRLLR